MSDEDIKETNILIEMDGLINTVKKYENSKKTVKFIFEQQVEEIKEKLEEKLMVFDDKIENSKKQLMFLMSQLDSTKFSETKTQKKLELLSGNVILKKEYEKINLIDSEKALDFIKNQGIDDYCEYIKVKESINWENFKKNLVISEQGIINVETGQILDKSIVDVEKVESKIIIK